MSSILKIIYLVTILMMLINFISSNSNSKSEILFSNKNEFPKKSIYFSSLNEGFSSDLQKFNIQLEKPHKTNSMLIKIEKNIPNVDNEEIDTKNFLSVLINKSFFKITSCLQHEKIPKKFKNVFSNSQFVEISNEKNVCYYKQDYLEFDFINLSLNNQKERFTSTRHSYYKNLNLLNGNKISDVNSKINLEGIIDMDITNYKTEIENFTSDFLMWNEHSYFELVFIYDPTRNLDKFNLHKIFIYFSHPSRIDEKSYYISLIKNGVNIFDNIFIFHKNSNKLFKYSQGSTGENEISIEENFDESFTNFSTHITTRRDESIYHNTLLLNFDKNLINGFSKNLIQASGKNNLFTNEVCFHIFQPLTEDSYIEKNEFRTFLKNLHNFEDSKEKFDIIYSKFIDQELSSDLIDPYYLSFILCENLENLDKLNYQISYPIHFRYQPALDKNSSKSHQSVVMPQPFIQIFLRNSTFYLPEVENFVFDEFLFNHNILDKSEYYYAVKKKDNNSKGFNIKYDEKKLFYDEIQRKLKFNIGYYNNFLINRDRLVHQVPAGKQEHFLIVLIVTVFVTIVGFLIIIFGLFNYLIRKKNNNILISRDENEQFNLKKEN